MEGRGSVSLCACVCVLCVCVCIFLPKAFVEEEGGEGLQFSLL